MEHPHIWSSAEPHVVLIRNRASGYSWLYTEVFKNYEKLEWRLRYATRVLIIISAIIHLLLKVYESKIFGARGETDILIAIVPYLGDIFSFITNVLHSYYRCEQIMKESKDIAAYIKAFIDTIDHQLSLTVDKRQQADNFYSFVTQRYEDIKNLGSPVGEVVIKKYIQVHHDVQKSNYPDAVRVYLDLDTISSIIVASPPATMSASHRRSITGAGPKNLSALIVNDQAFIAISATEAAQMPVTPHGDSPRTGRASARGSPIQTPRRLQPASAGAIAGPIMVPLSTVPEVKTARVFRSPRHEKAPNHTRSASANDITGGAADN